jgi:hypothetical protein
LLTDTRKDTGLARSDKKTQGSTEEEAELSVHPKESFLEFWSIFFPPDLGPRNKESKFKIFNVKVRDRIKTLRSGGH